MLGQDNIAIERPANRRVIGRRRGTKSDHIHIQTGLDLHQSRRVPQSALQQLMAGQICWRPTKKIALLCKGRREQGR